MTLEVPKRIRHTSNKMNNSDLNKLSKEDENVIPRGEDDNSRQ